LKSLDPDLVSGFKSSTYVDPTGRTNRQYEMDRDSSFCLVAGYDVNSRMRIIKRWQELEASATTNIVPVPISQLTQHEIAVKQFKGEYEIWNLLSCPVHIAQQEIVKIVRKDTGVDFSEALKHAAAQQNILPQQEMLEPTDLGIKLGLGKGKDAGAKLNSNWVPTALGEPHCQKHAWTVQNKSGYNLKWSLDFVQNYFNNIGVDNIDDESEE